MSMQAYAMGRIVLWSQQFLSATDKAPYELVSAEKGI